MCGALSRTQRQQDPIADQFDRLSKALRMALRWRDESNRDRWVREHVLPALASHGLGLHITDEND
jgi:hypothetical protein